MPDITLCSGAGCARRQGCQRYNDHPALCGQSYFSRPPIGRNGFCPHFLVNRLVPSRHKQTTRGCYGRH